MQHFVVFEVRVGSQIIWAWCLQEGTDPGFKEMSFTKNDGMTPADHPETVTLQKVLFTIMVVS